MNLGLGISPYPGKIGHGDYGPHQGGGLYYRPGIACPLETFQLDVSSNVCGIPSTSHPTSNGQCGSCE